jgi:hypothetical protein
MAPMVLMRRNLGAKFPPVDAAAGAAIRAAIGAGAAAVELPAWLSVGVAR